MEYYVVTSEKQNFSDGSVIYKVWIQNDNGGLCFVYSKHEFANGDQVLLGVRGDKNNRAALYVKSN